MMKIIGQTRRVRGLLNPEEVLRRAERPLHIGLIAPNARAYADIEEFLIPGGLPRAVRAELRSRIHRGDDESVPDWVDVVLYHVRVPFRHGAFALDPDDPHKTVAEIVKAHEDLALPLARQFPGFRAAVVERIVHAVSLENAMFSVATALPNVVPSLVELPWALGEFASDTVFLTVNQIRMAFHIAAACGHEVGFGRQKAQILAIAGGAFGWRALARELAGHIPFGGGLIPKGAIAYAGTFLVGKGLEYLLYTHEPFTREQRGEVYRQGLERGRSVAESMEVETPKSA